MFVLSPFRYINTRREAEINLTKGYEKEQGYIRIYTYVTRSSLVIVCVCERFSRHAKPSQIRKHASRGRDQPHQELRKGAGRHINIYIYMHMHMHMLLVLVLLVCV